MEFYVYSFLDPRKPGNFVYGDYEFACEPFYVGKGKGDRYKDEHNGRNTHFRRKIRKIKTEGLKPVPFPIDLGLTEKEAFELEIELITLIGRSNLGNGPLTNLTDGGDGTSGYKFIDKKLSASHKMRIRQSMKNVMKHRIPWNTGRKLTEEHKRKISRIGVLNGFYGREHTQKAKMKMSDSIKLSQKEKGHPREGAKLTEKTKAKIGAKNLGMIRTKEVREKMKKSAKFRPPQSQETKSKRSKTLKGHFVSEETRKKISDSLKRTLQERKM